MLTYLSQVGKSGNQSIKKAETFRLLTKFLYEMCPGLSEVSKDHDSGSSSGGGGGDDGSSSDVVLKGRAWDGVTYTVSIGLIFLLNDVFKSWGLEGEHKDFIEFSKIV